MLTLKGWNGGGRPVNEGQDELTFFILEGGGSPALRIEDEFGNATSFCFDTPKQVSQLIEALQPFTKEG